MLAIGNVLIRGCHVAFAYYLEEAGQRIQVERMVLEDSATAVYGTLLHRDATLHLEELALHGMTLSNIELDTDNGNTEIERSIVEDGVWTGILAGNGGVLTLTGVVIRDIESDDNCWDGAGIAAHYTNTSRTAPGLVLRRVLIDRVRDAGIAAFSSIIDAEQLVVRGVRRQACTDTCVELVGGDDFDVTRLTDGVRYRDNNDHARRDEPPGPDRRRGRQPRLTVPSGPRNHRARLPVASPPSPPPRAPAGSPKQPPPLRRVENLIPEGEGSSSGNRSPRRTTPTTGADGSRKHARAAPVMGRARYERMSP